MKASYKWLKELVDFDLLVEELAFRLTDAGLEVENIATVGTNLNGVVVGEIKKVSPHPQADKLSVCLVSVGTEDMQIVCGAPNVKEKAKVPVALIDARLPSGEKITKSNLRGVESFGMICSEKELEIGEDAEGIMILDPKLKVGELISSALELEDHILDIAITPNRPDWLSMIGVAREVAALCGSRVKDTAIALKETSRMASDMVQVEIIDATGCPRYAARIIEEIRISESPFWLKRKLQSAGMRSINNVVDVTNLVMLELGHPLHAFDFNLFPQKKVVVRRAKEGEKFVTLDQVERTLNQEVLLITNGAKAVAIGGIMGGSESEVTPETRTLLLESAYFDPKVIRRGRMFLDLSTESSQRFERGADPNGVIKAMDRAAQLLADLAGGGVLKGVVDNYPSVIQPVQVTLRPKRVNRVLSTDLTPKQIKDILTNLEIPVKEKADLEVEVPTFRPDLTREIDLIEEIARIYGYANIKTDMRAGGSLVTEINREDEILGEIKQFMRGKGFFEVITNNLVDPDLLKRLNPGVPAIEIKNPLSRDLSVLTTSLVYNSLTTVGWNKNRLERNIRIFELGKVFTASDSSYPQEKYHLGIALSGSRAPRHWETKETEVDLYDLKGVLEELLGHLSLSIDLIPGSHILFDPDKCFMVKMGDDFIGLMGGISKEISDLFEIKDQVLWAELDVDKMISRVPQMKEFSPLPKFPPADRDIAVVVDEDLLSQEIIDRIKETGGELVEDVVLFDVYGGKQIQPGKKSLACSIRYRSPEKTLTDEEVEDIHRKVILQLEQSFGAALRQ
jgi:phenylalanyl-tRNA synthetase beta chain